MVVIRISTQANIKVSIKTNIKALGVDIWEMAYYIGFASMAEGNLLSEDEQWKKLELVAEVARRVWGTT